MNITLKTHKLLGCRGVTRSILNTIKVDDLLEINTQPGMTNYL